MAQKQKLSQPTSQRDDESPSQDYTDRHGSDVALREMGFVIVSRPKSGPTLWKRKGKTYTQQQAETEYL
jgi:hypothetical protein